MKRKSPDIGTVFCRGVPLDLVSVEGGEFEMGGNEYSFEKPVHRVKVGGFCIGRYPVTQRLWQAVMGSSPSRFPGAARPVETVSWEDVREFLEILNKDMEMSVGPGFRLPTEAEWEFAARGGNKGRGFVNAGSDRLEEVGWYNENSYGETKPVGLKLPNELGIFDMSGNVWEWCCDWYGDDYYQKCAEQGVVVNPVGPETGVYRVLRGGSIFGNPGYCRAAARLPGRPDYRSDFVGFRLVVPCQTGGGLGLPVSKKTTTQPSGGREGRRRG